MILVGDSKLFLVTFENLFFSLIVRSVLSASINPVNSSGARVREQNRKMRERTCESMHVREPREKER